MASLGYGITRYWSVRHEPRFGRKHPAWITLLRSGLAWKASIGPCHRLTSSIMDAFVTGSLLQKGTSVDHMTFLNPPTEEVLPSRRAQQQRRRVVMDLLGKFSRAYP